MSDELFLEGESVESTRKWNALFTLLGTISVSLLLTLIFVGSAQAELLWVVTDAQGYIRSGQNYGCVDRSYFDRLVQFTAQKDIEAFEKLLKVGLVSGMCEIWKPGTEVYLVEGFWSSVAKVRPRGEVGEYWTFRLLIEVRKNQ